MHVGESIGAGVTRREQSHGIPGSHRYKSYNEVVPSLTAAVAPSLTRHSRRRYF